MSPRHERVWSHPLDPLYPEEIEQAHEILTSEYEPGDETLIIKIELEEPSKDELAQYEHANIEPHRQVRILMRNGNSRETIRILVSLDEETVLSREILEDAQPSIAIEEFIACEQTVKENEEWQRALERRGVENTDRGMVDPWSVGHEFIPEECRPVETTRAWSHIPSTE